MNAETEMLQLLRRIAEGIERLAPVERAHGNGLSSDDRAALAALLPVISAAIGDLVFSVDDLRNEAKADDDLQAAFCELSPRQLGRLFARGCGHQIAGCRIERAGEARDGALWRVSR